MILLIFLLYFLLFVFGLIFGSFLNALEWRLYKKKSLWTRSECPNCHKQINWYDNIPVLSFLLLKTKCRNCKKKISWQYPAVELVMGLLFVFVLFYYFSFADFSILSIIRDCLVIFVLAFVLLSHNILLAQEQMGETLTKIEIKDVKIEKSDMELKISGVLFNPSKNVVTSEITHLLILKTIEQFETDFNSEAAHR